MKQKHSIKAVATKPKLSKVFLVCGLAAFFYLYEFLIRVMPSAIAHDLMHSFKIHASSLGWLSALFFYGYMPLQIPAGLLFDRWGARKILALSTLGCSLATAIFALTSSFPNALFLRFAMGFCGAFAFTGAAFTATNWVPRRYFAMYTGLIQTLGCVGAIAGQAPIAHLNAIFGWRNTNIYTAVVGIIFSILIYAFVRNSPQANTTTPAIKTEANKNNYQRRLKNVLGNTQNWWIGCFGCLSWASINLFAALWGIPYLMKYYQTSAANASAIVASCWVGVAIGSPVIGWWSKQSVDRLWSMLFCIACGFISSLFILLNHNLSMTAMVIIMFCFGLSAGGQPISFDLIYDNNKKENAGAAIGFNNMCVIAGSLILQPLAGYIIQHEHQHSHLAHYQLADYRHALLIIPFCFIANTIITLYGINKKCRCHNS